MRDLTVVIVTFDRQPLLNELLARLSEQTVLPEVVVSDDGTRHHLMGHEWPIITRYLWRSRDGYHRVERYNEAVRFVTTPYLVLLDDDCLPDSRDFVRGFVEGLQEAQVVRGMMRDESMSAPAFTPWFSTANLGCRTSLALDMGPFDPAYDGRYGFEDNDLEYALKKRGVLPVLGTPATAVLHRGKQRPELHAGYEANREIYKRKWSL